MDKAFLGFLFALLLVFCFVIGWSAAHDEVSRECRLQGNFYVGNTAYKCEEKK